MSILEKGRRNCSIKKEALITYIYHSKERYQRIQDLSEKMVQTVGKEIFHTYHEKNRVDQMKTSMETLAKMIRLKQGDFINDNPHELTSVVNFEVASTVSAIMIKPVIEVLGSEE